MSHDQLEKKLIRMGNQIATFFSSQNDSNAALGVAEHINKFWDPRMRKQLFEIADQSTDGFQPLLVDALPKINRPN